MCLFLMKLDRAIQIERSNLSATKHLLAVLSKYFGKHLLIISQPKRI